MILARQERIEKSIVSLQVSDNVCVCARARTHVRACVRACVSQRICVGGRGETGLAGVFMQSCECALCVRLCANALCVCARACVRACVCLRACVRACVRACLCV